MTLLRVPHFEIKDRSSMRASCKIRYAYIYRYQWIFAAMVPQPILLFEAGNSVRMLKCLKPSMLACCVPRFQHAQLANSTQERPKKSRAEEIGAQLAAA